MKKEEQIIYEINTSRNIADNLRAGNKGVSSQEILDLKTAERQELIADCLSKYLVLVEKIDNVIEELEKEKCMRCLYGDDFEIREQALDDAIEIVKQGLKEQK